MEARGYNGQMSLHPDKVRITKKDAVDHLVQGFFFSEVDGSIDVPIGQIINVEFARAGKPPGYEAGYIKLDLIDEPKIRSFLKHVGYSPFGVAFERQQEADFEALRAAIVKKIDEARIPKQQTQLRSSVLDELGKLAALRDQGVVTEQEFIELKKKLLETETDIAMPVSHAQGDTVLPQAEQPDHCKLCGKRLSVWNKPILRNDICNECYARPKEPKGQIESVHLESTKDYQRWVRKHGSKVEIIDVSSERRGWNLLWGPIGSGRVRYTVTFKRK
jgi:hypothetical protein